MRIDEVLPALAAGALRALGGAAAKTIARKVAPKLAKSSIGMATQAGQKAADTVGRRIGAGRNPTQDRGTGGAFSGNPPKKSLGSIGSMPGAKTASIGADNNPSLSPTTDNTPGTKGTIGTQSAADMRKSASNDEQPGATYSTGTATGTQDMQTTQSNTVEPEELKTGDKLTVKVEPGNKNLKLVYPDETEALVPRELLRIQHLAGIQS